MCLSPIISRRADRALAQPCLGAGRGSDAGMEESPDQRGQIEAAVEAILRLGEVARQVLRDIDMVIKVLSSLAGLHITQFDNISNNEFFSNQ